MLLFNINTHIKRLYVFMCFCIYISLSIPKRKRKKKNPSPTLNPSPTPGWLDVGVGVRLMRAREGGVEGGGGHKAVDLLLRNHKSATLGGV
jgi:hypothetical protein